MLATRSASATRVPAAKPIPNESVPLMIAVMSASVNGKFVAGLIAQLVAWLSLYP